jgi:peptidoglycan/xylan/chitin deacetylase (PgdA/CDA1 family)
MIALEDYIRAREAGTCRQLPRKALIITYDDGHRSNAALKPVWQTYGVRPTIFLCSGVVGTRRHFWFRHDIGSTSTQHLKSVADEERLRILGTFGFEETREFSDERQALSKAEIEELKGVAELQAHTLYHPLLPRCPAEKARQEIGACKRDLEHGYGLDVYAFSYPNGDYSQAVIDMVRAAGYRCALTIDGGLNSARTDPFRLGRICIPDDAVDVDEILVRASSLWESLRRIVKGPPHGYTD